MGKKILDQYTDRTDLTPQEKWHLRHPEYRQSPEFKLRMREHAKVFRSKPGWKEKHASEMRVYRDHHPESHINAVKKYEKKKRLEKINRLNVIRSALVKSSTSCGKGKRNEIMSFYNRGKSMADICIWTNVPMSVVSKVINENHTGNTGPTGTA